jgi:hypothetical protein
LLEAATRAAAGEAWVRDAGYEDGPPRPRHATVRRQLARAARLLGLSGDVDERQAEAVALALDLAGLDHTRARRAFAEGKSLRERGGAIVSALERMPLGGDLEGRLLLAGFLVGLWGPPLVWDALRSRATFPRAGTILAKCSRNPPSAPHEKVPPPGPGPPLQ